jgi:Transposase DDE domain
MSCRKQPRLSKHKRQPTRCQNRTHLLQLLNWFLPDGQLFAQDEFHGNIQWNPQQLVGQALIWSWQETKFVTAAFDHAKEACDDLSWTKTAMSYTSFMNALDRYHNVFVPRLRERYQVLAEEVGGRFFRTAGWVLIGFDGSRATAPRTVSNERVLCAPNYGHGKRAKYGKKKSQGLRRQRNREQRPHPQAPQAWITMLWHMGLRLPWTWRLGPSNASEREHVQEMLAAEEFPEHTLFCGDAGFVGYPLWSAILKAGGDFVVRVGANVSLLSEQADVKQLKGGIVLCWPKGKLASGEPPLRLRLVQVKVGKTKMWLLTSVLDRKQLSHSQLIRIYKLRWGIEVEFRGLKQTIDKHTLRCRNSDRLWVELDWSLRGMAVAELLALREQIAAPRNDQPDDDYDPQDRSLANTLRALRKCLRNLTKYCNSANNLLQELSQATVQRYANQTDKRARYRPKNPDKKPLGDPTVRKMSVEEREKLRNHHQSIAA